jgi:hypothetical protein
MSTEDIGSPFYNANEDAVVRYINDHKGKEILQLVARPCANKETAIGGPQMHELDPSNPDARHVYATWERDTERKLKGHKDNKEIIVTIKSMEFFDEDNQKITIPLNLEKPVDEIAKGIAHQLEGGMIKPVHARAVFEMLSRHHLALADEELNPRHVGQHEGSAKTLTHVRDAATSLELLQTTKQLGNAEKLAAALKGGAKELARQ